MAIKKLLLCVSALLFFYSLCAQKKMTTPYKKQWAEVDSLVAKDMPKSADKIINEILKDAVAKSNIPDKIKAQVYLISISEENIEGSDTINIHKAETYAAQSTGIEKAIWQSITAGMYWQYYQQNRWQLYNRTQMQDNTSDDIATWDVKKFTSKISELFLASIAERDALKSIPVEKYLPIIIEGKNTRQLRPTLCDLLVFRAIDFFENDEKDITDAAYKFEIDNPVWFDEAVQFSAVRMKIADANSLHFKALQLYQEIIDFHLQDNKPDALIDADLQRLRFVYQNSISNNKDSLYRQSLERIITKYPDNAQAAIASFSIVSLGLSPINYDNENNNDSTTDYVSAARQLQQIITKFPNSEAAALSQNLLNNLHRKSLNLQSEQVVIPNENSKILLTYQNVPTVYFRLYKIPSRARANGGNGKWDDLENLQKLIPINTWSIGLLAVSDMKLHKTEIKINPLPEGQYILLACSADDINTENAIVASVYFTSSNISFVSKTGNNNNTLYVLHRKSGRPLQNVTANFYMESWNNKKGKSFYKKINQDVTDEEGKILLKNFADNNDQRFNAIELIEGNDTLFQTVYMNNYFYDNDETGEEHTRTFIFTDRAIYRPGQTIYFKAITVKYFGDGKRNEVLANNNEEVTLYDANNQAVKTLHLTTNGFGSVSGSFTAPDNGLTGGMSIRSDDYGYASVSVEEYKRPKFYVEFDTLKDSYVLNQAVKVKGFAKAYSGVNIDGAQVKYRIVRNARFPYYWCYFRWGMPASPQMEIKSGTAVTQADGSFELTFETIPDKKVNEKSSPVFTYTAYADITDMNGETRSGNIAVNAGYRSLQIIADIPEDANPKDMDSISITTQNLNGIFIPADIELSIAPLQYPGKLYRQRLWDKPDQFVMTESEFRQAFPDDEYKEDGNFMNWKQGASVLEKNISTQQNGKINIPQNIWKQNGWYVIELKGKDAQGNEVTEKKYTHIWNPENKSPVQKAFAVQSNKDLFAPGDEATIWLATAFKEAQVSGNSSLNDYNFNNYSPPIAFRQKIKEENRGGIAFSWVYVYNNRVYQTNELLNVPWSNKDLQIEWATHRDKLQPGDNDEWTMTIKGNKKEKIAAEMLAGMYDASLDAFKPHYWNFDKLVTGVNPANWTDNYSFGIAQGQLLKYFQYEDETEYEKSYDELIMASGDFLQTLVGYNNELSESIVIDGKRSTRKELSKLSPNAIESVTVLNDVTSSRLYGARGAGIQVLKGSDDPNSIDKALPPPPSPPTNTATKNDNIQIRTNLNETAFFFPELQTDADGNVKFKFTLPEALTEWKLMAFAHTKDWQTGYLEGKIKTQKDLMVVPNLPRFLRQGDDMVISTKINSLSDKDLDGTATLEILNAETLQPLDLPFRLHDKNKDFSLLKGQSTTAVWHIHIPESIYTPVIVRVTARTIPSLGGGQGEVFSDGEENTLPVITNRVLVTETLPLPVRGNDEKTFSLDKLKNANSSTLLNNSLTVEFTGNPAWYAVQALPYLMEYPYECAEQTFNRYYSNALAAHIIAQSPKVAAIFDQWKNEDTSALVSNLSKNEELKSALLEETPWVMEAKDETEQKHRIAMLFQANKLSKDLKKNIDKLEQMQLPEGGFPWFKGMRSDRYITQYIVTGIARLQHLGVSSAMKNDADKILNNALPYLDRELKSDYDDLIKYKANLDEQQISYSQVQYLYMRSFFVDKKNSAASQKAFDYYKNQAAKYWPQFNPYMKGMIALALNRLNDHKTANDIITSLKETAVTNEETGMYWKEMPRGYWWYEAPIEAQSLLVEAFTEVANDEKITDDLKTWLLKQKQTQNWETTKATADACYALLLSGSDWLQNDPVVSIKMGNVKTIKSSDIKTQAGTGYFKQRIDGKDIVPEMGTIKVKVENATSIQNPKSNVQNSIAWGAVYWQYFEDMDKVTAAATPLSLTKQLYKEQNSDRGPQLTEIKECNELKVGDKVVVRIILKVDRDMEYVHLKDMRAACFEPVNVLSQYKYQGGLGYYESTKDVSTNFFFDRINKGTYVFEYPVFVQQKGDFSNGIATIQCMYAPEFSSHSQGIRVKVE